MNTEEIKTKFKGPGEWRSQAEELEDDGSEESGDSNDLLE